MLKLVEAGQPQTGARLAGAHKGRLKHKRLPAAGWPWAMRGQENSSGQQGGLLQGRLAQRSGVHGHLLAARPWPHKLKRSLEVEAQLQQCIRALKEGLVRRQPAPLRPGWRCRPAATPLPVEPSEGPV